jgi:hypothetical protein
VLWLSACSTLPRPAVGPDNDVRRQAAVQTRWVGVTKFWTRSCPKPGTSDWKVRPLVPLDKLEPSLARSLRKAKLDRFCVYEYKGDAPVSRRLTLPAQISARLKIAEPDRVALSGMTGTSDSLRDTTFPHFSQLFLEQVQSMDLPVEGTSRVRLVFLDTQPTGEGLPVLPGGAPPRSPHGYTLGHIAGRLAGYPACGSGCAVEVATRLALPVVSFNPATGEELQRDAASGGFRGTFVDLYNAIVDETNNWLAKPVASRPKHLVLNLSVGWDGEKFGGWEKGKLESSTTGSWAIYGALKAAAEAGVLVIAAAGNERGGLDPTGQPLLPGGWEKPLRLSGEGEGTWGWEDIGQPLIYAASGVDGLGRQLVNTRRKGEAPRVAYADHVVVSDPNTGGSTATLTGTSVAAAVISTIAAVVWSYQPDLTRTEVMNLLYQTGTNPMLRHHNFSAPANAGLVRQVTLCRALSQAWAGTQHTPPDCAALPEPAPIDLSPFIGGSAPVDQASFPYRPYPDPQDQALAGPQPGVDPCPNCVIDPPRLSSELASQEIAAVANTPSHFYENTLSTTDYTLLVELPPREGGILQGATLEIFGLDGFGKRTLEPLQGLSVDTTLSPGETALRVKFPKPAETFQASLIFTLAPYQGAPAEMLTTIVNPLFVDRPDLEIPESSNGLTK